jgi:hypothetical protein
LYTFRFEAGHGRRPEKGAVAALAQFARFVAMQAGDAPRCDARSDLALCFW